MNIGLDKKTKERIEPKKGLLALCQCCETDLVPKCGKIKVHHWAHKKRNNCDHWWETETEWHRNWKNEFPIDWQEVVRIDPSNKERHIADILVPSKELVLEFQNSPIDVNEIESREGFYKKLIWVINANEFAVHTFPIQSLKTQIRALESQYISDLINPFIKVPIHVIEKLERCQEELLNNPWRYLNQKAIDGLMSLFNREIDHLLGQDLIGKRKGIDPNLLRKNLLLPIINKALKEVDRLVARNKALDEGHQYYRYTWSGRRKAWNYANLPVFLDRGKELYWIKSDCVIKKIPRGIFVAYYNIV